MPISAEHRTKLRAGMPRRKGPGKDNRIWCGHKVGWKSETALCRELDESIDAYFKRYKLRYKHLAITELIHPWDYRVMSGKRVAPTPERILKAALSKHDKFAA